MEEKSEEKDLINDDEKENDNKAGNVIFFLITIIFMHKWNEKECNYTNNIIIQKVK